MKLKRLYQTFRLWTIPSDGKRAEWAKRQRIYAAIGDNVRIMDRKVPLYANLIKFHNNIQVASNVSFITHDAIHSVFNSLTNKLSTQQGGVFLENIGCIEVMDNVFIGSGTQILGNVRIGPNAIVAAGSLINHDVPPNSIVGGVPAKVIGWFDDLVEKRKTTSYPIELKPTGQIVSDKLMQFMWQQFENERNK